MRYIQDAVEELGDTALVIAMEECSELQKAISKHIRNRGDITNTIEEIGDVLICIEWVKVALGISEEDINNWIEIKKRRIERQLDEGFLDSENIG